MDGGPFPLLICGQAALERPLGSVLLSATVFSTRTAGTSRRRRVTAEKDGTMTDKITREEVRHVADLARLDLNPDEEVQMTQQLNAILDYMEKLNEVDTSQVEPTTHAVERANVFREDVVGPSLQRDSALANAPQTDGVHFVVPKVI